MSKANKEVYINIRVTKDEKTSVKKSALGLGFVGISNYVRTKLGL